MRLFRLEERVREMLDYPYKDAWFHLDATAPGEITVYTIGKDTVYKVPEIRDGASYEVDWCVDLYMIKAIIELHREWSWAKFCRKLEEE